MNICSTKYRAAFGLASLFATCIAPAAYGQNQFIDDAQRTVILPGKVSRVFAAGAPAEVLLYTLAPEKLVGRNHLSSKALEFTPPEYQRPAQIMRLPNAEDAQNDTELLALKPDIYIDYGDVKDDYIASLNNVQQRTGIPGIILDGSIEQVPSVYRRLGTVLGVARRGNELARHAEQILTKYRGVLKSATPPRVYLACSRDGSVPCLEGERSGEIVALLGAINVAGNVATSPLRPITLDDMKAWNPDIIIALSSESATRMREDAAWQSIKAVIDKRIYVPPTLPFNWGPRPPSVNRLMGLIWLAYVLPGRPFDTAFSADMRRFFKDFYHVDLSDAQLRSLLATN